MTSPQETAGSGRHALVTGGAGFIGSHLAEALLGRGYEVTVIDNLSTGRFENISHLIQQPTFHFVHDHINNEIVMDRLISDCDLIFHLAAAVGVMLIVEKPVHTLETNLLGTESVLRIALRYRRKVLLASTSEVYGKGNHLPFQEDDDVVIGSTSRSRWSYAASKMVDEFLALAYHREYGLPVTVFRLFNTVGPRQTGRYGMVVPRFIEAALDGRPLQVFGNGEQSRCFLHVADAVEAILLLAEHEESIGQVVNIGSTQEIRIFDLARRVLASLGDNQDAADRIMLVPYEQAYAAGFEDMLRRVPDITRIQKMTGWLPRHDLDRILADVLAEKRRAH